MNQEQFNQQQDAARQIEAGVHDIARLEVDLGRALDVAAETAATVMMTATAKELGRVTERGAQTLLPIMREGIAPIIKVMTDKYGAERMVALMQGDGAIKMGEAYAQQALDRIGHRIVDIGRTVHKKISDADRAAAVPEPLAVMHSDPVSMLNNAMPAPLASGADILKRIEEIESRGRQYPAKRNGKR